MCYFSVHTGSETKPQQRQLRQGDPQSLWACEEGKHRGSVPPSPAQSPPQATQRHVPGAGRHHVPVSLPRCRGADCATAGHTAGVTQETGVYLLCVSVFNLPLRCVFGHLIINWRRKCTGVLLEVVLTGFECVYNYVSVSKGENLTPPPELMCNNI